MISRLKADGATAWSLADEPRSRILKTLAPSAK
jgi:hypothetical protein